MIQIKTVRLKETQRDLNRIGKQISDHSDFFREDAVPMVQREVGRIFRSRGYGRWALLSPATVRQKGHDRPLIRTRRYIREATQSPTLQIGQNEMTYGVEVPYADYHETGTQRIPARPVIGLLARNTRFRRRLVTRLDRRLDRVIVGRRAA